MPAETFFFLFNFANSLSTQVDGWKIKLDLGLFRKFTGEIEMDSLPTYRRTDEVFNLLEKKSKLSWPIHTDLSYLLRSSGFLRGLPKHARWFQTLCACAFALCILWCCSYTNQLHETSSGTLHILRWPSKGIPWYFCPWDEPEEQYFVDKNSSCRVESVLHRDERQILCTVVCRRTQAYTRVVLLKISNSTRLRPIERCISGMQGSKRRVWDLKVHNAILILANGMDAENAANQPFPWWSALRHITISWDILWYSTGIGEAAQLKR